MTVDFSFCATIATTPPSSNTFKKGSNKKAGQEFGGSNHLFPAAQLVMKRANGFCNNCAKAARTAKLKRSTAIWCME